MSSSAKQLTGLAGALPIPPTSRTPWRSTVLGLFTPGFGELTTMHIAVMGMMAQMALKDLGEKTKRGQLGRVMKGRAGGGLAYGYKIASSSNPTERGGRIIDVEEAEIVRRIFQEYAIGQSPEAIAKALNREGISGPGGRPWSNTTIRGQADRGTGILNNAIYGGVLEWNRCSYVKDPRTGRRVARPNPRSDWEIVQVPNLRIVDDEILGKVRARQDSLRNQSTTTRRGRGSTPPTTPIDLNGTHRSHFLLSGLLKCGSCGGGYTVIGKDRYGCATRRQKGTCENARTITRAAIESRVLFGLKERLLAPELVGAFIESFQAEVTERRKQRQSEYHNLVMKLAGVERKISSIQKAVEDGMYNPSMKTRLTELEAEKESLALATTPITEPSLDVLAHPKLAELYKVMVAELERNLDSGPDQREAMELIRSMIDSVVLTPRANEPGLDVVLFGALAAILTACNDAKMKIPSDRPEGSQLSVVAGAGFEPATFRL